jgi:predicted glutamine amidotransferase
MCRWIAYSGKPIFIDSLVTRPAHSLVEQSLNTKLNLKADGSLWTTNGDGFGVGWYDRKNTPGLFKDAMPAWNDENLHEICEQTEAHMFFAHIRASTNGKVQRTNSHPFKYKNWLFQHNGDVGHFSHIKRELQFDIAPELYPEIQGTTDSETCFYLALTYGLETDPKAAFEKMIKRLRNAQKEAGLDSGLNFSCSASDGINIYTIRYVSGNQLIKSQFYSTDMSCVKDLSGACTPLPKGGVIVVSEPLDRLGDKWVEIPENSYAVIGKGQVDIQYLEVE